MNGPDKATAASSVADLSLLTRATILCLFALVLVTIAMIVSGILEWWFLQRMLDGEFTASTYAAAEEGNNLRQGIVSFIQMAVFLISCFLVLRWFYRAYGNLRGLGARSLTFTPAWVVGWYFIPVLNLWKPYRAMRELWLVSHNPHDWRWASPAGLVPLWWGAWLAFLALNGVVVWISWGAGSDPNTSELLRRYRSQSLVNRERNYDVPRGYLYRITNVGLERLQYLNSPTVKTSSTEVGWI